MPFTLRRTSSFTVLSLRGLLLGAIGASLAAAGCQSTVTSGGGGGGAGGSGGTTSGNGGFIQKHSCDSPQPFLGTSGVDTGIVKCEDGSYDRVKSPSCAPNAVPACDGTEDVKDCLADSDCIEHPGGHCGQFNEEDTYCSCAYPTCTTDADCKSTEACVCSAQFSANGRPDGWATACVPATCRSGSDCASGECGVGVTDDGCSTDVRLTCRTQEDTCRVLVCGPNFSYCDIQKEGGAFGCADHSEDCQIGRPLLVGGRARTAARAERSDWALATELLDVEAIDPSARRVLGEHWTRIAAMEHASVASFARFSLQLLTLGAPPDLLLATQDAARDEVEHASFAYGLASAFAGAPVGPGPLALAGVDLSTDVVAIVRGLVEEACVSETIGVVEAIALADVAHPALRAGFEKIAADESEHARLAWASLSWMIDALGPEVGEVALEALDEAIAAARRVVERVGIAAPELGILDAAGKASARARALDEVIIPLRNELGRCRSICPATVREPSLAVA